MIATLLALVAFGTLGFWIFLFLAAVVIAMEVHFDKGFSATITLVATVVVAHFFLNANIFSYVFDHLGWFIAGAVAYIFPLGWAWSMIKLGLHTRRLADKYQYEKIQFLREMHLPDNADLKTLPEAEKNRWEEYVRNHLLIDIDRRDGSATFDLHKRQATIFMWWGHWPFSLLGTVLNDPVREAISFLYARSIRLYEKIIASNLGHTRGDILTYDERHADRS